MAIGWLAVLQAVPWGQVIDNAPKIVNGAKKLWSSVSKKPASEEQGEPDIHESSGQNEDSELRQRLAKLEKSTAELHEQMVTSTALIKELEYAINQAYRSEQSADILVGRALYCHSHCCYSQPGDRTFARCSLS
jgi:glycerol-3-phosphate dehydrogenase